MEVIDSSHRTYWLQRLKSIAQGLRLSSVCILCQSPHSGLSPICLACKGLLPLLGAACKRCALPLPQGTFLLCGRCIKKPGPLDQCFAHYRFEEPLRSLVHEYKYHNGLYLRKLFVDLMLDAIPESIQETDCLVPVPMHRKRLAARGFNQSAELAKALSRQLNIPYRGSLCLKWQDSPSQAGLNAEARKRNLQGVFRLGHLPEAKITLIDDLMTTGSTANALASLLKSHGAKEVRLWCCARAIG